MITPAKSNYGLSGVGRIIFGFLFLVIGLGLLLLSNSFGLVIPPGKFRDNLCLVGIVLVFVVTGYGAYWESVNPRKKR